MDTGLAACAWREGHVPVAQGLRIVYDILVEASAKPAHEPPSREAHSSPPHAHHRPLSPGALARLERLELVADAAADRFAALQREHEALRRRYARLRKQQQQQQMPPTPTSPQTP